jgi:hypothetical protein
MNENQGNEHENQAGRLARSADKLLASGHITEDEASRLQAAGADGAEEVERDIRVRHATAALNAAVEEGRMTAEEAEGYLRRLRSGEHSKSLRSHLRQFRRRPGPQDPAF